MKIQVIFDGRLHQGSKSITSSEKDLCGTNLSQGRLERLNKGAVQLNVCLIAPSPDTEALPATNESGHWILMRVIPFKCWFENRHLKERCVVVNTYLLCNNGNDQFAAESAVISFFLLLLFYYNDNFLALVGRRHSFTPIFSHIEGIGFSFYFLLQTFRVP